jgi:hypothetical protein
MIGLRQGSGRTPGTDPCQILTNQPLSGMNFFLSIEKRKSIILESPKFFEYTNIRAPGKRGSG